MGEVLAGEHEVLVFSAPLRAWRYGLWSRCR